MRNTLAFNGSYFNTNRMVKQYTRNAYYPVRLLQRAKVEEEQLTVRAVVREQEARSAWSELGA
jgi:hypothetical protein